MVVGCFLGITNFLSSHMHNLDLNTLVATCVTRTSMAIYMIEILMIIINLFFRLKWPPNCVGVFLEFGRNQMLVQSYPKHVFARGFDVWTMFKLDNEMLISYIC